jgi:MinD-like ATPase involved in chromosome partitioning or flagellar assembly
MMQGAVRIVANRYGQPGELPLCKVEACLGRKVDAFIPDDPKTVNASINVGAPAVTEAPKSKFTKSLWQLAEALSPDDRH